MKRLFRALLPAVALTATMSMVSSGTAYAVGATAAVVRGSGSISPGLSTTPTVQTNVTFDGAISGLGIFVNPVGPTVTVAAATNVSCSFVGSSTGTETSALGQGSGTVTCDSATGGNVVGVVNGNVITRVRFSCTLTYQRIGPVVRITGMCTVTVDYAGPGSPLVLSGTLRGVFVFVPRDTNPTRSYDLVGVSTLDDVTCPSEPGPGCV